MLLLIIKNFNIKNKKYTLYKYKCLKVSAVSQENHVVYAV